MDLYKSRHAVNQWLERFGVRFGIYKNGKFVEQLFPYDPIPRILSAGTFERLQAGLLQRVQALNLFLTDIYQDAAIVKDGIIPEDFVFSSKGFLRPCLGITPPRSIYAHIAGIDLVESRDGNFYVLEDNLRIPSGASYPIIARTITRKVSPKTFEKYAIRDNRDYPELLKAMFDYVNDSRGINVILTPGRYNSAFFEHSFFAEKTGAVFAFPGDLKVESGEVYYTGLFDERIKVGAVYRRIADEFLDPLAFRADSLLGVPGLMEAYRAGNVAIINSPGNGVADDKGIYYFVPKMITYYLNEKPLLANAPTYLPCFKEDLAYIEAHLADLVIKDVSEAGGYGVVFGRDLDENKLAELKTAVLAQPRRFIAQEVIDFQELPLFDGDEIVMRKADLRAFVVTGEKTAVWPSGLTRFSRRADSFVVNSSQGGGFKDTLVIEEPCPTLRDFIEFKH